MSNLSNSRFTWIGSELVKKLLSNQSLHVGELKWTTRTEDFNGWFVCDGRSLSRTEYKDLFAVIGTKFGSNCENTFLLPNAQCRVVGVAGENDDMTTRDIGDVAGAETHALTESELPAHTHTGTTSSNGAHTHTTSTDGAHSHTSNATGGSIGLAYQNGQGTLTEYDSSAGELNLIDATALTINSAEGHTHTISSDGAHTHTFTTSSVGAGSAHSIVQPTIFMNLMIFAGYKKHAVFSV